MLFHFDFSLIALIGIILLIGIVKKNGSSYDRLVRAIEQRDMREYGLPITSRPRVAADAPMHLLDFGTAELRYAGGDLVQLND